MFTLSIEKKQEIEEKRQSNIEEYKSSGKAAIAKGKSQKDFDKMLRDADTVLEEALTPQELQFASQIYLKKMRDLVQDFNHNRYLREKKKSTLAEASNIAYEMRSIAPFLINKIDVSAG